MSLILDSPGEHKSWKAEVQTTGDPKFYANAIRLATRKEAEIYASDLSARWLAVADWRVVESDDPPNYAIKDGALVRLQAVT